MVTRKTAIEQIYRLLEDLVEQGYQPTKAYLFGSVATGTQHAHSDIDLAVWDERFTGCLTIDYEPIKRMLTRYPLIELHTFPASDSDGDDPWAKEIQSKGLEIDLQALYRRIDPVV